LNANKNDQNKNKNTNYNYTENQDTNNLTLELNNLNLQPTKITQKHVPLLISSINLQSKLSSNLINLLEIAKERHIDILLMQDIGSGNITEYLLNLYNYNLITNTRDSKDPNGNLAILINKQIIYNIQPNIHTRIMKIELIFPIKITVYNIYAQKNNSELDKLITSIKTPKTILGGDFNSYINKELDFYSTHPRSNNNDILLNKILNNNFIDPFREFYPQKKKL